MHTKGNRCKISTNGSASVLIEGFFWLQSQVEERLLLAPVIFHLLESFLSLKLKHFLDADLPQPSALLSQFILSKNAQANEGYQARDAVLRPDQNKRWQQTKLGLRASSNRPLEHTISPNKTTLSPRMR
eukprot:m.138139 g.138139  ORF g.138139 m.138139 type:complete len:129 (-) comp52520_c0_seq3:222-608(-)